MATIVLYETFWSSGCYYFDMLAAFDDAIRDGVHVISVSLDPDAPQGDYLSDAIYLGSFHDVNCGILFLHSIGNEVTSGSVRQPQIYLLE